MPKFEISWVMDYGEEKEVIEADSHCDALEVAEQRWHEANRDPAKWGAFELPDHY